MTLTVTGFSKCRYGLVNIDDKDRKYIYEKYFNNKKGIAGREKQ